MGWRDTVASLKSAASGGSGKSSLPWMLRKGAIEAAGKASSASGAGAAVATEAGKSGIFGAGVAAGSSAVDAISDPGFVLFIVGILTFLLKAWGNTTVLILISTILLFYTSFFVFKGRGMAVTVMFWVWYIFFGATMDSTVLLSTLLPLLVVGIAAHGIFNSLSKKGTFAQGAAGELIGWVPVAFFLLDLGGLAVLMDYFRLPLIPLLENVILFTPWWAFLGIFCTKKENFWITFFKFLTIVYIFAILAGAIAPEVYSSANSALPGPSELVEAQQRLISQLPERENPAWSNFRCMLSDPTGVSACVAKRQLDSELESVCVTQEGHKPGTPSYEQCITQERERRKSAALLVSGSVDPTIKIPMKAELKVDKNSFPQEYYPEMSVTADFVMENPRRQLIVAEFSCNFTGKGRTANAQGIIQGGQERIEFTDAKFPAKILCSPETDAPLNGTYTVFVTATLRNLETRSKLQRAFIGTKTPEEKERLLRTEISKVVRDKNSLAPAEFAFINFDLGQAKGETIIEEGPYRRVSLTANVENGGRGRILSINRYYFPLEGFVVNNERCREGSIPTVAKSLKKIALPPCVITDYPAELKDPPRGWEPKTFEGVLQYDYELTAKEDMRVPVLGIS